MTVGFVRATKAYLLPSVLEDVFTFRKAFLTLDGVLRKLFNTMSAINGTAIAVTTLRGNHEDTSVDCQGFQPTGYSNVCPWGLLSFVESAASSLGVAGKFTEAEVRCLAKHASCDTRAIFKARLLCRAVASLTCRPAELTTVLLNSPRSCWSAKGGVFIGASIPNQRIYLRQERRHARLDCGWTLRWLHPCTFNAPS